MPNDKLKLLAIVDQLRAAVLEMADDTPPVVAPTPTPPPTEAPTPAPTPPAKPITSIVIENTGGAQSDVPFTFGQVFAVGDFQPDSGLAGRLASGDIVPLQVDVKALHADGSVRHAIVSGVLPTLFKDEKRELALVPVKAGAATKDTSPIKMMVLANVKLTVNGATYQMTNNGRELDRWLHGAITTELGWRLPLVNDAGAEHSHLAVRFAARCYDGERTRVEVVIENNWAYEPGPQNFTYDVLIEIAGKQVFEQKAFLQYHHARWRKVLWVGEAPAINVRHDPAYLIGTRAVPNYDQSVAIAESELARFGKLKDSDKAKPMAVGMALPYMPNTGGREDIGLQPGWAAAWLLSQDRRAAEATLITADLSGSWSMHYRDQNTGQPISLIDFPYMTLAGNYGDTRNPVTKKYEAFPSVDKKANPTPNVHDISHQPNLVFLPYLLTGEFYYLEELQFWAMYDVFNSNPNYRGHAKGWIKPEQVRGQAWALRTLAEAAYITPDDHRLKAHFVQILDSNLDWYIAEYPDNPAANKLGFIANGYWVPYANGTSIAPWMDDFFTSAAGHVAELGFKKAEKLVAWKSKFPTLRMVGEGAEPIYGAMYEMKVRDSKTAPLYETIAKAFSVSKKADASGLKPGEMTGYSSGTAGYPSNMQPALAYAADFGGEEGKRAWRQFMSRSVKPDYGFGAQFAIVPRTM